MNGIPLRLVRYVTTRALITFCVCLGAVVGIYLVIDFADRAKNYTGPDVLWNVTRLYAARGVVIAYQLAPAALLLAAGACTSTLRQRRETTAMSALTVRPGWLYTGIGVAAALVVTAIIALDPWIGKAGEVADNILNQQFHQWGDYNSWFAPRRWFRSGNRVYFLRQYAGTATFNNVSVFTISDDFRLAERVDAERMEPQADGTWKLSRGAERTFPKEGESAVEPFTERIFHFPEKPDDFALRYVRPEEIPVLDLSEEVRRRRALGLPSATFEFALHNKIAYPMMGIPAALLAAALALRRGRTGHLTTALMEGVAVVAVLWGQSVIFKSAANNGHLAPHWAAWTPVVVLSLIAAWAARALA